MKKLITIVITLLVVNFFIFPRLAIRAAEINIGELQPSSQLYTYVPRIKINKLDVLTKFGYFDSEFLKLPDSVSPINFLVGEKINLSVNNQYLGYTPADFEKLNFVWDFDDGEKILSGHSISYSYLKPGSYVVSVGIIDQINNAAGNDQPKQFAKQINYSRLQINIIPAGRYDMPEASLVGIRNPTIFGSDRIQYIFDLSHSRGIAPLKFLFDYGDGNKTHNPISIHTYFKDNTHHRAAARVWDDNKFFDDEFVDIYPSVYEDVSLITKYTNYLYRSFETSLNNAYSAYRMGAKDRLSLLGSTFSLGLIQIALSPLLLVLLVAFGLKRYGTCLKSAASFSGTYIIMQSFFTLVLVFLTLYYEKGFYISDIISKVLLVLGIAMMVLLFSRVLIIKGERKMDYSEMSSLGAALGVIANPFSFALLAMNLYFMDIYDALYLLLVFTLGSLISYLVLIKLGQILRKILFRS